MNLLTPLRRHSIRRALIRLGSERGTFRRRPEFVLTARSLIRIPFFNETVCRNQRRQSFKPKTGSLAGVVSELVRLEALGIVHPDQSLSVAMHDGVFNGDLRNVGIQAEFEKSSCFAHSGPSRFIWPVDLLPAKIEPQHPAIAQEATFRVRNEQIPMARSSFARAQYVTQIILQMVRRPVIGRDKIATPSIVTALAEGFADNSRTFTADEYAHVLPSFAFWVWVDSRTFVKGVKYIVPLSSMTTF